MSLFSSPKAVEQYINNLLSVNEALLQPSPVLLKKRQNTRAMGSSFGGTGNLSPQGNRPVRSHSLIADLAGASLLSNVTASSSRFDSDETKVITSPIKQEGSPQTSQTNSASAISEKEPSICEICGQKFTKSGMLRLHMDTHSNRQKLEFQCSICSAVFRSKISYQNHLSSHSYDSTSQPNSDIEESAANGLIIKSEVPETNFSCQEEDSHGHSSVIRLNSEPISSDGAALKLELKMVRSAAEGISTKEQQGASPLLDTPALVMAVNESLGKSGVREMVSS